MIITNLSGGLGNQMFQYAVGRALAYRNQTDFKMDLSGYKNQIGITPRQYELFFFNILENFSSRAENQQIKGGKLFDAFEKIFDKLSLRSGRSGYIIEKGHNFNPRILNLANDVYLQGYWQNEKYFLDCAEIIRSEFTLRTEYNNLNPELLNKIKTTNSVSLHIRRGDYISSQVTNDYHGTCSLDYYQNALKLIAAKSPNPVVFVFSDDLEWCQENLKIDWPLIYVEGQKNYEDLILMSQCRHNIIANSSFSWWGAWLNNNLEKIVVAPKQWFAAKNINMADVVPAAWIQL